MKKFKSFIYEIANVPPNSGGNGKLSSKQSYNLLQSLYPHLAPKTQSIPFKTKSVSTTDENVGVTPQMTKNLSGFMDEFKKKGFIQSVVHHYDNTGRVTHISMMATHRDDLHDHDYAGQIFVRHGEDFKSIGTIEGGVGRGVVISSQDKSVNSEQLHGIFVRHTQTPHHTSTTQDPTDPEFKSVVRAEHPNNTILRRVAERD